MTTVPSRASDSDWELISPARPRRSQRHAATSRSPKKKKRKKQNTCAALCEGATRCSIIPVDGLKWCLRHNEERIKLYASYKTYGALLDAYPEMPACTDFVTVRSCDSLSLLKECHAHLRRRHNLLTRCIEARIYFTRKFFDEDMDFGHRAFWNSLVRKRSEVGQLMREVETRGFQLILKHQNAQWVLERDSHDAGSCSDHADLAHETDIPSLPSAGSVEDATVEDPLEAILRQKAFKFREKIRRHLARFCVPSTSRFHAERLETINAYVRRAIYEDASLMFLSQSYDSVLALLSDQDLDPKTTEAIWKAIDTASAHDILSAVDDVLRLTEGEHVVVLGGKVFKDISGERWPLHAWGHMIAFRKCYSCLRASCRTVDEIVDLTRYVILTRTPLSQAQLKYKHVFDGSRELILAGFIPNSIPPASPRKSISCRETGSHSARVVWDETQRNITLCAGLSLSDPMTQKFGNACLRCPDFMVVLRKGADGRVIRSAPVVWTSRKRSAPNEPALTSVPWEKAQEVTPVSDMEFVDALPLGWLNGRIVDCMQVIIVDASEGDMSDIIRKLVAIWCQVYEVGNKDALYEAIKRPYKDTGELEAYVETTDEIARDYYRSLWGCTPPSTPTLI